MQTIAGSHEKSCTQRMLTPQCQLFSNNKRKNKAIIWGENCAWEARVAKQYLIQFIVNYSPSYQDIIKSLPGVKHKSRSNRNVSGCCKQCEVNIHTCLSTHAYRGVVTFGLLSAFIASSPFNHTFQSTKTFLYSSNFKALSACEPDIK